jgi:hypothetical protein
MTKKQSGLILLLILVAVISTVVWFWILPTNRSITEIINNIQAQRGEIEQLQQQRQTVVQDDPGSYDQASQKIAGGLVAEDNIIKMIEELEKIAGQAGVEYQLSVQGEESSANRATASQPPDQKDPSQAEADKNNLKLSLSLKGSFPKHLQVLKKIEYLPMVINLDTILIKKNVTLVGTRPETAEPVTAEVIDAEYAITIPLSK